MSNASTNSATVLVIEDEAPIRRFLKMTLTDHGFIFKDAHSGKDGLQQVAYDKPDVVILDLGLPDMDGLEVTKQLREWTAVPIIVLSARGNDKDKVDALDAGADDYLTKPFSVTELLARIRVALRHSARVNPDTGSSVFTTGDIRVDLVRRQVFLKDDEVHLTPIEYKLLVAMIQHAGKVLTHNQLLREIWGLSYSDESHYIRVYMAQLRRKLEADPAHPRHFMTEPGVGYRLRID